MTKQQQFFYDNAGYSVAPGETTEQGRERCAVALATAETWAVQEGLHFEVAPDADADDSWMDSESQAYQDEWRGKAWYVAIWDSEGRNIIAALGGCYGDKTYERVVKAELALEAIA